MKRDKLTIITFSFVFLFGLVWTFLVPPFQKADESTHYFRAVSVSRGEITCPMGNVNNALEIPKMYFQFVEKIGLGRIAYKYEEKTSIDDIMKASREVDYNNKDIQAWEGGCNLSIIPYLIFAVPILIGDLANSLLFGFFLSRLLPFVFFFFSIIWSFRKIQYSRLKWVIIFYALTPMVLHQASAIGYDYLNLSLIPILFALNIDFIVKKNLSIRDILIFCFLLLIFILAKPGYYFVSLIYFLIPWRKITGNKRRYLIFSGLLFIILIFFFLLSQKIFSSPSGLGIDFTILEKFKNPVNIFYLVKNTLSQNFSFYIRSFIGTFGWLDYSLSPIFEFLYILVSAFFVYYLSGDEFFKKIDIHKIGTIILMIVLSFALIFGGMYIAHMHLNDGIVLGVQGRYFLAFLPYLIILGAFLLRVLRDRKNVRYIIISLSLLYIIFEIIYAIYRRYY